MGTTVGLIYAAQEGGLISVVVPDSDAELDTFKLQPGEAILVIAKADYQADPTKLGAPADQASLQARINAVTKKVPVSPRCALVDAQGNVVAVHNVYPSTFAAPKGFSYVQSDTASPGDTFIGATLVPAPKPVDLGTHPTADAQVVA